MYNVHAHVGIIHIHVHVMYNGHDDYCHVIRLSTRLCVTQFDQAIKSSRLSPALFCVTSEVKGHVVLQETLQ